MILCVTAHPRGLTVSILVGQARISLENTRDNKILIEENAIVRYFSVTGLTPWLKSGEEALKDYALIEFEESRQDVKVWDVAERIVSKANFGQVGQGLTSSR